MSLKSKLITFGFLAIVFMLLFTFSNTFKLIILFLGIFIAYKNFPPEKKKFSNFEFGIISSILFVAVFFLGKGFGFLSVFPSPVQPVLANANLTPLNITLLFIIGVLFVLYLHGRRSN